MSEAAKVKAGQEAWVVAACKSKSRPGEETGVEELRRVADISKYGTESSYDGFTAEQCLNMFRACWASVWDILPDVLTLTERRAAARSGKLSVRCLARLERVL